MTAGSADIFMRIIGRCKAEVSLTVNPHTSNYESVDSYMQDHDRFKGVEPEVLEQMKVRNLIFELQMYPDTPVGSWTVYHYDINRLMVEAADCLNLP